tara:strand:+ start:109 stop:501 length:393 start_codon:yes stop_codon:yes gene_type:complete
MKGRNTWIAVGLVALAMALEAGAEVSLATWAQKNPAVGLFVLGIFLYAVIGAVYGYSLKFASITIANTLWQLFSIIVVSLIGILAFQDKPTVGQWAGLGFSVIGAGIMLSGSPELGEGKGWYREWSPVTN